MSGRLQIRAWIAAAVALAALSLATAGPAAAQATCAVDAATMTAPGCILLRSDTGTAADPRPGLWGRIDCVDATRHELVATGGDPKLTATGLPQGDRSYRALRVHDGDAELSNNGERCELGRNEHRNGENGPGQTSGTFALYREGQRKITFFSHRYDAGFPLTNPRWQTVMQMKQTQPSAAGGGIPMLELQIHGDPLFPGTATLYLDTPTEARWNTLAPVPETWAHYALDVVYSADPAVGSVKVYADLNGDFDALDPGEQSPTVPMQTLKVETSGGTSNDGIAPGESIPAHLRTGVYHDPVYACPSKSGGCGVGVDNVQVLEPPVGLSPAIPPG